MSTTRIEFAPTAVLSGGTDPVTGRVFPPRRSTTQEQRQEAEEHALEWMKRQRVWIVEYEVAWTHKPTSRLTITGHAEHLGPREIIPCHDTTVERDLEGRVIVTTLAEDMLSLEREVEDIYGEGLQ